MDGNTAGRKHRKSGKLLITALPLADGLYGVILVFYIWRISHRAANNLLSKFRPWSENRWKGQPNLVKNSFTAARAVSAAVFDGNGIISIQLVNWSTIMSMCSFPAAVLGTTQGNQYVRVP